MRPGPFVLMAVAASIAAGEARADDQPHTVEFTLLPGDQAPDGEAVASALRAQLSNLAVRLVLSPWPPDSAMASADVDRWLRSAMAPPSTLAAFVLDARQPDWILVFTVPNVSVAARRRLPDMSGNAARMEALAAVVHAEVLGALERRRAPGNATPPTAADPQVPVVAAARSVEATPHPRGLALSLGYRVASFSPRVGLRHTLTTGVHWGWANGLHAGVRYSFDSTMPVVSAAGSFSLRRHPVEFLAGIGRQWRLVRVQGELLALLDLLERTNSVAAPGTTVAPGRLRARPGGGGNVRVLARIARHASLYLETGIAVFPGRIRYVAEDAGRTVLLTPDRVSWHLGSGVGFSF